LSAGYWDQPIRLSARISRGDVAAHVFLIALPFLIFREALSGRQVLFTRDISMVWYAQVATFVRCIAEGSWPVWDPWRGFGQPLLADPSAQVLYPTTWLNLILPPWLSYLSLVLIHMILTAVGVYALARHCEVSRFGATLAGALWTLSGTVISLTTVWHHLASAAWIPWVLLAADRAFRRPHWKTATGWALALSAQILAGSADMVAITGMATAGLAASYLDWRRPLRRANGGIVGTGLLAFGLALGLTAAQWAPTLALARASQRWNVPPQDRLTWSLHPAGLASLALPMGWGRLPPLATSALIRRELQGPWLGSLYAGCVALALALAGVVISRNPRRRFLLGLAAAGVLMALGRHTPLYALAITLVPPLRILRFPIKWIVLTGISLSLLAGMGVDSWRADARGGQRWTRLMLPVLTGVALVSLALAGVVFFFGEPAAARLFVPDVRYDWVTQVRRPLVQMLLLSGALFGLCAAAAKGATRDSSSRWAPMLALMAVADLAFQHRHPQPLAPPALWAEGSPVLPYLDRSGQSRVYVYDYSVAAYEGQNEGRAWGYHLARVPVGWSEPAALVLGVQIYLNPPTAGRFKVLGSYDVDLLGLYPRERQELTVLLRRVEGTPTHLRLLRMGAVKNVIALHPEPWWGDLISVATVDGLFVEPIRVFEVPDSLPRAYVVSRSRTAQVDEALSLVMQPDFDAAHEVVLSPSATTPALEAAMGSARILPAGPDRVRLEVESSGEGFLVLVDSYDPGWHATVDGRGVDVLRANVAFRAVAVGAGRHVVEMMYRPRSLVVGGAWSVASFLALGIAALMNRR
jgi:Bacterial membrane protein YfhO